MKFVYFIIMDTESFYAVIFFSHRLQFYAKYLGLAYFRSDFVCFGVILSLIGRRISLGPPHSKAKLQKTAMN